MNKIFAFFISFIIAGSSILNAQNKNIFLGSNNSAIKIVENSHQKLIVKTSVPEINIKDINTNEGLFSKLIIDGYTRSYNVGKPQLPSLNKLIEIPQDANVKVKIVSFNERTINLASKGITHKIAPSQPSIAKNIDKGKVEFKYNKAFYSENKFNTDSIAKIEIIGTMRGVNLGRLIISPFRYNPSENILKIYTDIVVEIDFEGANIPKTQSLKQKTNSPYFEATYKQAINYKTVATKDIISKYPIKYIIVSDPMFKEALQPFIEWKTKKGFYVIDAYTDNPEVGNTNTSIKNYLANLYNSATENDPAPTFVLLVGDVDQIPDYKGVTDNHYTDLYYFDYTGDYLPEVYYGRFSANNLEELQPQIDKTLEYEQYLMPNPSFLDTVVMISGVDATFAPIYGNGQISYGINNYFNKEHGITSFTYLYSAGEGSDAPEASKEIIQHISDGVGYANYTAHCNPSGWGNPSFQTYNIKELQNVSQYPLLVGNCCQSSTFHQTECFAEAMLRAKNKGAIGYIGGSNYSYWDEDFYWGVGATRVSSKPTYDIHLGAFDRMFHDHGENKSAWYITNGQMVNAGNLAVTEANTSLVKYYWEIYNLMGDPSLMNYFSVPSELSVSYNKNIVVGDTSLIINCDPDAYVALSYNNILLDAKVVNEEGIAHLSFAPIIEPSTASIVATKQNRQPFIGELGIIRGDTPFVIFHNFEINDSLENNNSLADYGENIFLNLKIKNVGKVEANNLSVTLSTDDDFVSINNSIASVLTIPGKDTSLINHNFILNISDSIPDQHKALINVKITDDSSHVWNSLFNITLNAPNFDFSQIVIDDTLGGNANNRLDCGEAVKFNLNLLNNGHADLKNASCKLTSTDTNVTIINNSIELNEIDALSSTPIKFPILLNTKTPIGNEINFVLILDAGYYSDTLQITKNIGLSVENWEKGTYNTYNWDNSSSKPWTIDINPYEGIFCAKSGNISFSQSTKLSITIDVIDDDTISFYNKVSSEGSSSSYYDYMEFFIDNISQDKWAGTFNWSKQQYPVSRGEHIFTWSYNKDENTSEGFDCAWIDYISFPYFNYLKDNTDNTPEFVSTPVEKATDDEKYLYNIRVDDIDTDDRIIITCVEKPSWLIFADNGDGTANLTGTPDSIDIGNADIILSAFDGTLRVNQYFNITITEKNVAPLFSSSPSIFAKIYDTYNYYIKTSDKNINDTLKISCLFKPEWLNFIDNNDNTAVLSGIPGFKQFGANYIVLSVTDGRLATNQQYSLYVTNNTSVNSLQNENVSFDLFPNPAINYVKFVYNVEQYSKVNLQIFNILGKQVSSVVNNQKQQQGEYSYSIDTEKFSKGIFYCRLMIDNKIFIKKLFIQ
ncbi:MAG: T9SS type A sorting domain-containing protein [Bacteroidetes bacterium]|nr:T9SS type A sorting domain-containing protein [Bacteroidota bacterium]